MHRAHEGALRRRRGRAAAAAAVCLVSTVLAVATPPSIVAPAPAAASVTAATVSYHPAYTPTQVQTFHVGVTGPAPGGDGTYRLGDGVRLTEPIHYTAMAPDLQAALTAAGFDVASVTGGPDGLEPFNQTVRFLITFATDPGVLLIPSDNQTQAVRPPWVLPGYLEIDCVWCMDLYPPTVTPNGAAVAFIHGGGLHYGSKDLGAVLPYVERLRAQGYLAISMNHRLGTVPRGFTVCDIDADYAPGTPCAAWLGYGADASADVQLATQWLTDHAAELALSPGRVAVVGGSAGGIAALGSLYLTPPPGTRKPMAAVSIAGAMRDEWVTAGAPPALIGAYTHDPGLSLTGYDTFSEGRELQAKGRALGNTVDIRAYAGSGHVPELELGTYWGAKDTRPEAEDLLATMLSFFSTHLLSGTARLGSSWSGAGPPYGFTRPAGSVTMYARPTENRWPIVGDFDGDGRSDLFWYTQGTAPDSMWFTRFDGTFDDPIEQPVVEHPGYIPFVDQAGEFTRAVVGDFDANGCDDVLFWGAPASARELWQFCLTPDGRPTKSAPLGMLPPAAVPYVLDADGDGRDDVLWYGPGIVPDWIWFGAPAGFTGGRLLVAPTGTASPVVGDFDGDDRSDVLWHRPVDTEIVWFGRNDRVTPFDSVVDASWSTAGSNVVSVGHFDADGRADVLAYGYGFGADALLRAPVGRTAERTPLVVYGSHQPIVGDFDGDLDSEVLWYTPGQLSAPLWYGGAAGFTTALTSLGRGGIVTVGRFDGWGGTGALARADLFWR